MEEKKKTSILNDKELTSKVIICLLMYIASIRFADENITKYLDINDIADKLYLMADSDIHRKYGGDVRKAFNDLRNEINEETTIRDVILLVEEKFS